LKLLLDEHYANEISVALRAAGHDAVTVSERGLKGIDDASLLALAAAEGRALLTNNAQDFVPLVTRWSASGDGHCGLLLASDSSLPRGRDGVGRYIEILRALMDANPGAGALADQVRWLP
jgi:predicted nuclease of predicted toxin-antitoxin system